MSAATRFDARAGGKFIVTEFRARKHYEPKVIAALEEGASLALAADLADTTKQNLYRRFRRDREFEARCRQAMAKFASTASAVECRRIRIRVRALAS